MGTPAPRGSFCVTAIFMSCRVPTGHLDRVLSVALDTTTAPAHLVITTLKRPADGLTDNDFRPTDRVISLEARLAPLLVQRIRREIEGNPRCQ